MTTRPWRQYLVFLFVVLFLVAATPRKKMAIPSLGETIEVSIVNVDVFVTDKDGKRVHGLTKDDFEVYENGVKQPVSNFAEYDDDAPNGTVSSTAGEVPVEEQRRTIVLFLERFKLPTFRTQEFIASMKKFVHETVRPGDAMAIVTWDRSMKLVLDYTDDVAKLDETLGKIEKASIGVSPDIIAKLRDDVAEIREFELGIMALAQAVGFRNLDVGGADQDGFRVLDVARAGEATGQIHALGAMNDIKGKTDAINAMISTMAGSEGKKILLLATHRLSEFAGAEFFYAGGTTNLPQLIRTEIDAKPVIKTIVDNANASGVTVYPIYPTGLAISGADSGSATSASEMTENLILMNETVMLRDVAQKTGGLTAWGTTDIAKLMPSIADDVSDYYSLAYRANAKGEDKARNIVVKAKNPNLTVRARQQFVEKSDATRMKDRVVATLFQDLGASPFKIGADIGAARSLRKTRHVYPLAIRIPIKDLTLLPQGDRHAGAFSVFLVTSAAAGGVGEVKQQTQSFEISQADLARAQAGHFTYNFDVVAEQNTDRIAVGVLDEVSKTYSLLRVKLPAREPVSATR